MTQSRPFYEYDYVDYVTKHSVTVVGHVTTTPHLTFLWCHKTEGCLDWCKKKSSSNCKLTHHSLPKVQKTDSGDFSLKERGTADLYLSVSSCELDSPSGLFTKKFSRKYLCRYEANMKRTIREFSQINSPHFTHSESTSAFSSAILNTSASIASSQH